MTSELKPIDLESLPYIVENGRKLYYDEKRARLFRSPLQKCIDQFEEDFIALATEEEVYNNPDASVPDLRAKYKEMIKKVVDVGPLLQRYRASRSIFLAQLNCKAIDEGLFQNEIKEKAEKSVHECLEEFKEFCDKSTLA